MQKAIIYARYSAGANQTDQSIEGQLHVCYDYAQKNGITIVGEYIDKKITGRSDQRPQFLKMIADSARRQWEIVLVYQLDRFSRNKYDSAIYKQKLAQNGVKVVSAREHISDDASGILMESLLEGMAAYYSKELSQKIIRGREVSASKFQSLGYRPGFGLKVVDKQIAVDEEKAPYVERIYQMYANGKTMNEIIDWLNSVGLKTYYDKPFTKNSLRTILRNKKYCGIYTFKGVDTPDVLPRLVSQELFDEVQRRLEVNCKAPGRGRAVEDFILTTRLFCGHCLSPMAGTSGTSHTGKLHSYYACNNKLKAKSCSKKTVLKKRIEDEVVNMARSMLTNENMALIAREVAAICEKEKDNSGVKRLKRLIRENEKQKANLLGSLKVGKPSATAANYVFSEIDKLEKEQADLEKQIVNEENQQYGLSEVDIYYFLEHLRNGKIDDMEYRKLLVNSLVNSVYLYDDKMTIIFNSSNQPVSVDVSLLEEIKENTGSCMAHSSPPSKALKTLCFQGFYFSHKPCFWGRKMHDSVALPSDALHPPNRTRYCL